MGTNYPLEKIRTYMNFGKPKTKSLNKELEKGELFVNLANEYFRR
jgi:hypothetical protein